MNPELPICFRGDLPGTTAVAALATVARANGLAVDARSLRALAGVGTQRADGVMLLYAAGRCGFDALPLEGEFEQLPELILPAIATFRDESFHVLFGVDESSATVGNTMTGEVAPMKRDAFVAQWTGDLYQVTPSDGLATAQEELRRLRSPAARVMKMLGLAPFLWPRLLYALAAAAWVATLLAVRPVTMLTGACVLMSLWMAAYPRGCQKCGATSTLTGRLPVAWIGTGFYLSLTLATIAGPAWLAQAGLLAATGAHAGLVGILVRKRIGCYPCLATAAMAFTATALTIRHIGVEWLAAPAALAATLAALTLAARMAQYENSAAGIELAAKALAEPPLSGKARLVVYTRKNCPLCAYYKTVIRPTLAEEFGEALVIEEREAGAMRVAVPMFFVSGITRLALAQVGTDEMLPRLGAAIGAALDPASRALGELGGLQAIGFFVELPESAAVPVL